jgi:hypothetical protein
MDAVSSITYIDPSLEDIDIFDFNRNFNVTYGDASGTLASNAELDQILDTDQIPIIVSRDPSDQRNNKILKLLKSTLSYSEYD